jgi:hypothetical protein
MSGQLPLEKPESQNTVLKRCWPLWRPVNSSSHAYGASVFTRCQDLTDGDISAWEDTESGLSIIVGPTTGESDLVLLIPGPHAPGSFPYVCSRSEERGTSVLLILKWVLGAAGLGHDRDYQLSALCAVPGLYTGCWHTLDPMK